MADGAATPGRRGGSNWASRTGRPSTAIARTAPYAACRSTSRAAPSAFPLVLTHGWPGSVLEFENVLGLLSDPVNSCRKVLSNWGSSWVATA
ncbi:epoxide hydrolase N-terminal domain-containing protein [Nonomuraea sp. NPDC005501]|uniref:epoxide hydrolase N-terminal domain-containing protein n=1 Tax=Nonomuraea sp. NPDC005501 TaxID=3156884 RepID=UPI0033AB5C10